MLRPLKKAGLPANLAFVGAGPFVWTVEYCRYGEFRSEYASMGNELGELLAARKRVEELEAEKEEYRRLAGMSRRLLDIAEEAVFHADADLRVRRANDAFVRLFGAGAPGPRNLEGEELLRLLCGRDEGRAGEIVGCLSRHGTWEGEIAHRVQGGEPHPASLRIASVPDDGGKVYGYVGIVRDLSELRSARAILEYSARHDALTGLPNREYFHDALQDLAARADREGCQVAVCVLDLDDFKRVNNDLSRELGDGLLKAVGGRLSEALRSGDLLARTGGDEFSLAFPIKSPAEVRVLAARILGLFDAPFETASRLICIGATMGVALCPDHGKEASRLSACADMALQTRKAGAKSNYTVYREDLGARLHGKASLASELRLAIDAGAATTGGDAKALFLEYQPLVEMKSGLVASVEALARWKHPERGSIPPSQFIPLAEESGLIVDLGDYVLKTACAQARRWLARSVRSPRVGVNVSARQLQDPGFVDAVRLAVTGLPPGHITLEITESQLFEDLDWAASVLVQLKAAGVLLSVDDFGTGYASLSYLRKLPLDAVKIDQSFVADLVRDRHDRRIVEAVVTLARELGARTVAEGVETKAQLEMLREIGCDYAQGFLFSPALAPESLIDLVDGAGCRSGFFFGVDVRETRFRTDAGVTGEGMTRGREFR
jgi:diguanylate cyclase (GGDEF)-like protein